MSTHPVVFDTPWSVGQAVEFLDELLSESNFGLLVATSRHQALLMDTVATVPDLRGNVLHDVHTAVLMREHGISRICTRDADFRRFPFLTVIDPLS